MKFSEKARELSKKFWDGSHTHPFVKGLADGTLSDESFRYYLIQDGYYLIHFSRLFGEIADRAEDKETKDIMTRNREDLEAGEIAVREDFFKDQNISDEEFDNTEVAPTADHYIAHMYRQIVESEDYIGVAVAGMLPCPWLYQDIGAELVKHKSPVPIYQSWIDTYVTDEFNNLTERHIELCDKLYDKATEDQKERMLNAFYMSVRFEYLFFDMSYKQEEWVQI
ncbi:thiaminase II [Nosocomiicoccus sp. HMSC067E10]|uniref:thiaminase II n=1 Tax=Nosocomiicoccus sp. HMSC067E10 TaxID=1739271 RepID=UPI0008A10952|nr:thiaminase II [Nosocomiicoccus sp. HMSC067E10]OFL46177.1 thiaminase II [Nosocomiicoccus sp. HMSC067E10]